MQGQESQPERGANQIGDAAALDVWLRRRRNREAVFQIFSALVFAGAGGAFLVIISFPFALLVFDFDALFTFNGFKDQFAEVALFLFVYLLLTVACFIGAWKNRFSVDYSNATISSVSGGFFQTVTNSVCEILFAGPRLLITGWEDFSTARRLMRLDVVAVSLILTWLYDKWGKAHFREISAALPALNIVRVLPQLRDLPGVTLLEQQRIILLSEDLREEIGAFLGRGPNRKPEAEAKYKRREEPRPPRQPMNDEVFEWYRALGLPSFAPMRKVKMRYRQLVKIHHPDVANRQNGAIASDENIKRINAAYHNILKHSQEHEALAS